MSELEENQGEKSRLIDIPKEFYSDLTGKVIEHCVSCEKNLIESGEPYVIEKAFRYYQEYDLSNTIFEYAMCMPCAQKMHNAMSKESLQRIQEYFDQIDLIGRSTDMWEKHGTDYEAWTSNCMVKGSSRSEQDEFQICAQCIGDKMILDMMPYMLSMEVANEISDLLSNKTLDEYDRFIDEHFGLPPDIRKAIKSSPSVLV